MVSILTAYLQKPKNSFIRLDSLGWDTIRVNYIPLPENAFNAELHLRLYRYVTSNSNPYVLDMAIWVAEFSNGGYNIRKIFA